MNWGARTQTLNPIVGAANDGATGDAQRRGYGGHNLKPQRSEAQQLGRPFPQEQQSASIQQT